MNDKCHPYPPHSALAVPVDGCLQTADLPEAILNNLRIRKHEWSSIGLDRNYLSWGHGSISIKLPVQEKTVIMYIDGPRNGAHG